MKKVVVFFYLLHCMVLYTFCQSWAEIELTSNNSNNALLDAQFWGDTGIVVLKSGKIFQSNDFFESFTEHSTYANSGFAAMSFVNRDVGYISSCLVQGGLLKTVDGGNTWSPLPFGPLTGTCVGENLIAKTLDTLLSARREASNCLLISYDAGQNWYCNSLPYNEVLKLLVMNDTILYALLVNRLSLGMPGILNIYRSDNFGANWQNIVTGSLPDVSLSSDFHFIDDSTIVLVVDGAILLSKDRGLSFDSMMVGQWWTDIVSNNVKAISFSSHDTGFVAFKDKVYKTTNAGNTWIKTDFVFDSLDEEYDNEINFIKAISSNKVVLGCKLGNMYVTKTGGGIWSGINEMQVKSPTLHPNPATTTITLNGTEAGSTATITNLHGQVLLQLTVNNQQQSINIEHLPPGMYFCMVQTGGQHKVLRFVRE